MTDANAIATADSPRRKRSETGPRRFLSPLERIVVRDLLVERRAPLEVIATAFSCSVQTLRKMRESHVAAA